MAQTMNNFIIGVTVVGIVLVMAMFIAATIQDVTYNDGSGTSTDEVLTAVDNITDSSFTYSTLTNVVCGDVSDVTNSTGSLYI